MHTSRAGYHGQLRPCEFERSGGLKSTALSEERNCVTKRIAGEKNLTFISLEESLSDAVSREEALHLCRVRPDSHSADRGSSVDAGATQPGPPLGRSYPRSANRDRGCIRAAGG